MILNQHYLGCLSQASYLLGDERSRVAVVVDPRRDVEVYLQDAARHGLAIRHVVLTHVHADFAAGHLELQARTGAAIHLGWRARAEFPHAALREGDRLEYGEMRIEALETPGHTPESISLLVYDLARSAAAPRAVLTGDTLFLGDVGRPDLLASSGCSARELAGMLYDSLHGKLLKLPDATLVYPGHGAGSLCGKFMSNETVGTVGEQRRSNYALQPMSREEFIALVSAEQPPAPDYFRYAAAFNGRRHALHLPEQASRLPEIGLDELEAHHAAGTQLLDCRPPEEFAAGHWRGSLNVGLDGRFASWAGAVLDPERPVALIAPEGRAGEAATRLARVGFDRCAGFLDGGPAALAARPDLLGVIPRLTPRRLAAELESGDPPLVVDVRNPAERAQAAIPGSVFLPLTQLRARAAELPAAGRLVLHCKSGYRSMIAASVLAAQGCPARLADLAGGFDAWLEAGNAAPAPA